MHSLFLVCLVGGLSATGLLALFGGLAGHGLGQAHLGHSPSALPATHAHLAIPNGGQGHPGLHTASSGAQQTSPAGSSASIATVLGWTMSWISPLVIASAVLWFGAGGLLADLAEPALSLPVAIAAAVVGALVVRMLVAAFARADTEPLYADANGAVGVLNAAIRPDGVGEVIYVLEGLHRTVAARSLDGTPLPRGTNVVIVRRERGVAYVSPLDPLSPLENGGLANVLPDNPVSRQVEP